MMILVKLDPFCAYFSLCLPCLAQLSSLQFLDCLIEEVVPLEGDPQKSVAILNAMGWPKQKTDAYDTEHPTSVHYEYYPDGNLKWTRINDDETTKIRLEYDHAGNRTLLHDPDYCLEKKDLTSIYNAFGEEVSTTTPRDLTTTYLYDQFGRMTQRTENEPLVGGGTESRTTVWTYYEDAASGKKGLLHTIAYPGQTITYSYDDCQRVRKEEAEFDSGESYITRYTYDEAARKAHVLYPSGYYVHYHYNDIGHFRSITDSNGNEIYRTEKTTPLGQTERFVMAGNIVSTREYHPEKHTLTHIHTAKGENILQNLRYDYDGFGNLAFRKDETRNLEEHFEYDHLNRLKVIKRGIMITGTMEYDPYGRMTKKVSDNTIIFSDARYDINTKPHAIDEASCGFGVIPEEEQNITYTCFDKVKTITEGGNTLVYTYGYDRQRIFMEEHANGVDRTKRYVGSCEFLTTTTGGSTTTKALTYLNSPTGIFAVVETDGDGKHTLHYVLKDHLGSWSTITDCNGAVEQELSYDAWGNRRDPDTWRRNWYDPALEEPMFDRGYTGHEHMTAFGLINMNGRCYDPVMSSFLSVDAYVQSPENSQSFNRYTYCMNNPLKYVDPSGWVMVGGMTPGNPFHENWSVNYGVPVHGSSDFNNAYYKLNMALYGNMDGLCGGGPYESGGMGILSSYQAAMKYYQSASPNMVWSFSHLINNYVNNPSVFNRRELLDAGVTDYTYKTWWTAEGQGGYRYSLTLNHGTYNYGSDNYYYGYKGFSDVTIGGMDLSGAKSTDLNKANLLAQTLGVPMGSISEGFEMAAKAYHNVPLLKAKSGLSKPQYVSALTKEGNAILKFHKIAGKACFALSAGIEFVQMIDYHNNGGQDNNVYFKGGLDVVMGLVGLSGPIGFGISMVYFVADFATDGFYGWGKIKY